ncbi:MAG TPA: helix-turn-helix domain-containing protein [Chloroflexota bacterium]|nr:helix-turn-helix domain-containing protein [Chloroflexota bacterium]
MAAITVGETREALPRGTVLLGGAAGLGRPVTGTATFRARVPAFPALHGGEIALVPVALVRQMDPTTQLARLVTQLAEAGIAALVLLGAAGGTAGDDGSLEGAARAADAHGLALFSAPPGSTPEEVELALHRHLAGQREALLRRSQELQQEFTQLALAGSGIGAIVERLAAVTGQPAAWEVPAALEPPAWAAPPGGWAPPAELAPSGAGPDEAIPAILRAARLPLQRWSASLPAGDEADDVASLPLRADETGAASAWRRLVVPVHTGGRGNGAGRGGPTGSAGPREVAGYLSLIATEPSRGAETRLALSAAALAASIEVLRARTAWEAQGSAVASLVHDWLGGRLGPGELATRSMQLGLTLAPPYAVVVIDSDGVMGDAELATLAGALPNGGAAPLGGPLPHAFLSAALGDGRSAVVAPVPTEAALDTAAARLHASLADRGAAVPTARGGRAATPEGFIYAGIGRAAARPEDVPRAYGEALQALAVARRLGGRHRAAYFGPLGVYRVLAATAPAELEGFRRETLGGLLFSEDRSGGELLRTLEAYLLCGGSPQETAQRLHTHRNTVLYRLQRIGEALGVDVRAPEAQFTLWLALRAGDVLASDKAPQTSKTVESPPAPRAPKLAVA